MKFDTDSTTNVLLQFEPMASDTWCMKPLDYTLYNKVKEKFPPQPLTVIFISLKPENLEELRGIAFTKQDGQKMKDLIHEHARECLPYAAIGGFSEDSVGYNFCCHEFEQEEDLLRGQIIKSSIGTYVNKPVDIEALKADLRKLSSGIILTGNA
jgi:hypothetical protein